MEIYKYAQTTAGAAASATRPRWPTVSAATVTALGYREASPGLIRILLPGLAPSFNLIWARTD
jgi:hypothetical protein